MEGYPFHKRVSKSKNNSYYRIVSLETTYTMSQD